MPTRVLREAKDTGKIHVNNLLPVFFRVFGRGRAANDAGIVDQNIDRPEVLDGLFDEARANGRIAHVADQRDGLDAQRFELVLGGFWRALEP